MKKGVRTAALILGGLLVYNRAFGKSNDLGINHIVEDLPTHPTKQYGLRSISAISKIVIHHSASVMGSPYQYAQWHVDENGWPGIGYHFVIQKDGAIFQTNELETISYHARDCNEKGIGICLTGDFMSEYPTDEQYNKVVSLILFLNDLLGKELEIVGHHNCSETSCPGVNMDKDYIRSQVYGIGSIQKKTLVGTSFLSSQRKIALT